MGTWTAVTVDREHTELLEKLQGELDADSRISYGGDGVSLEVGGDAYDMLTERMKEDLPEANEGRHPKASVIVSDNTNEDGYGAVVDATGAEITTHNGEGGPRAYDVKQVLWADCPFEPAVAHKHPKDYR